jgi:hypothetical protein
MPMAAEVEVLLVLQVSQSFRARQCVVERCDKSDNMHSWTMRKRRGEARVGRCGTSGSAIGWLCWRAECTTALGKTTDTVCGIKQKKADPLL